MTHDIRRSVSVADLAGLDTMLWRGTLLCTNNCAPQMYYLSNPLDPPLLVAEISTEWIRIPVGVWVRVG